MEERAKFLHDTIAAQRRFLAEQRVVAIRNRPPIRTQLRSQMMTYWKHVGNKKHSDLKKKTFEEILALYKKSEKGASDPDKKKKFVKEDVLTKVPAKPNVAEQGNNRRERWLNNVSSPDGDYLVIYRANGNFRAFNYLLEVLHIFDRQDLFHLYDLVMKPYLEVTLEGTELILWGDLKIMMESSTEENNQSDFWNNQQNWEVVRWRLYKACGVYILELEDGTIIHMLVERRYPLSKELLQRMLDFGLEVKVESTAALDLIRFIKQQLNEE
ncbi:hypothetical protein Tco_0991119 [Tanacetum coccineum]|uniref:Uncharacterized protein n=1 Tax=Tanacetum coccineum TaxID=301880 RepID=A0ABQ5EYL8_9ASTR